MSSSNAFHVEGVIVQVLQPGVFRVELPNGHRLLGYVVRRDRRRWADLQNGERVSLELSPYDLSSGRIRAVQTSTS